MEIIVIFILFILSGVPSITMSPTPKKIVSSISQAHERCPTCERQFGPKAYDRHVEWCKERQNRIQKSPATVLLAKERLEARTKYRVPPLNKSKRAQTREKYSPVFNRTESVISVASTKSAINIGIERSPSIRKPKSTTSLRPAAKSEIKTEKVSDLIRKEQEKFTPKETKKINLEPSKR